MNLRQALAALAADWDGVRARLAPGDYTHLVALVVEFSTETSPDVAADIAEDIAVLLTDALPAEHPVRRELSAPESRFSTGAEADWGTSARRCTAACSPVPVRRCRARCWRPKRSARRRCGHAASPPTTRA
ncbi:hypothetical protein ACFQ0O_14720 [Saccharopolyspora spinosporotrichia]